MAAIALYRGAGFRVNRVRQTIYENGDDAFEMVLDH
jgi:ribosomal protein S18 acetylase RimI-like enzyme